MNDREPTPTPTNRPTRRRFSFSLRTLLIVTTLIVPPLSWFAYEFRHARETEAAIRELNVDSYRVEHRADLALRHWFGEYFMARIHGGRALVQNDAQLPVCRIDVHRPSVRPHV